MMADDLIEVARELARRDAGRPKSVSLRRAASSAYYALFHALAYLCTDKLIGWRKPYSVFTPIYRTLDHAKARSILKTARKPGEKGSPTDAIGVAFAALQDARQHADYSPEPFPFNRSGTIELIDVAEQAISTINALPEDEKLALAVRLVVKSR